MAVNFTKDADGSKSPSYGDLLWASVDYVKDHEFDVRRCISDDMSYWSEVMGTISAMKFLRDCPVDQRSEDWGADVRKGSRAICEAAMYVDADRVLGKYDIKKTSDGSICGYHHSQAWECCQRSMADPRSQDIYEFEEVIEGYAKEMSARLNIPLSDAFKEQMGDFPTMDTVGLEGMVAHRSYQTGQWCPTDRYAWDNKVYDELDRIDRIYPERSDTFDASEEDAMGEKRYDAIYALIDEKIQPNIDLAKANPAMFEWFPGSAPDETIYEHPCLQDVYEDWKRDHAVKSDARKAAEARLEGYDMVSEGEEKGMSL